MNFIHIFTEDSWDGLLRNGLFREGDGLKVMQINYRPPHLQFNQLAAIGGKLDRLLTELRCPFYVDRLEGGLPLPHLYRYSEELLAHYCTLLGNNFWGFQMHEWSSNYRSDYQRLKELYTRLGTPDPTPGERDAIFAKIRSKEEYLLLEAMTPAEWSSHRDPINRAMFLDDLRLLYECRSHMTGHRMIPADSYHMAPRIEIENGASLLLPEVGWQIPGTRMQLAYTRGMARAADIRWGVYYECWCYNTKAGHLMIPYSLREGEDECGDGWCRSPWYTPWTPEEREIAGTSFNLQERLWRYAYHSGATVLAEEWGVCNTFRDYHDYDLSIYGQTKRDFLRYTERHPEPGTPFTPIAVVLPAELPVFDVLLRDNYLDYPTDDTSYVVTDETTARIRTGMEALFGHDGRGNTGKILRCGGFPDVFDILHADQEEALSGYDYLIDLTGNDRFAASHDNIVTPQALDPILDRILPCRIGGDLHTAYNRTENGFTVLVLNNDGVTNDNFEGDTYLPDAAVTEPVRFCGGYHSCCVLDGTGAVHTDGDAVTLTLGAGEWLLLGIS